MIQNWLLVEHECLIYTCHLSHEVVVCELVPVVDGDLESAMLCRHHGPWDQDLEALLPSREPCLCNDLRHTAMDE